MPRHPRRYRKHGAFSTCVGTEAELLAVLERNGFMEVRDGQNQGTTDPREDHGAAEGGSREDDRSQVNV